MKTLYYFSIARDDDGKIYLTRNTTKYTPDEPAVSSPYTTKEINLEQSRRYTIHMVANTNRLDISFSPRGRFSALGWFAEWTVSRE